jgi:hypothetical protein
LRSIWQFLKVLGDVLIRHHFYEELHPFNTLVGLMHANLGAEIPLPRKFIGDRKRAAGADAHYAKINKGITNFFALFGESLVFETGRSWSVQEMGPYLQSHIIR